MESMDRFVDVAKLIEDKNPKLKKRLPKFVIKWLAKLIHQDEINEFMSAHRDKKNADFCDAVMNYFNIQVNLYGKEHIPREGGAVFASNHPLGGFDAIAIVSGLRGIREDIKFIVNDLLMSITNLNDLFVGVNKHGASSIASRHKVNELFASDHAVFIFPAGLVSRQLEGEIQDTEWKKTFVMLAKKNCKPVVPVFIRGRLTNRFYRLYRWRKRLGIKTNIEMLLLPDEFFKQRNCSIDIIFGKPIPANFFGKQKSDVQWAAYLRELVHNMGREKYGRLV
jgi:putative hemolysin